MNPWDNFVFALRITWIPYLFLFVVYVSLKLWYRHIYNRLPSESYTNEKFQDGYYVPKEEWN